MPKRHNASTQPLLLVINTGFTIGDKYRLSDSVHRLDQVLVMLDALSGQEEKDDGHKWQAGGKAELDRT